MNDQIGGTKKDIVCFVLCIHSFSLQLLETCSYTLGFLPRLEQLALYDLVPGTQHGACIYPFSKREVNASKSGCIFLIVSLII